MEEDTIRDNLRKIVKAYAKAKGTSVVNISRQFYGNHGFLDSFFAGEKSTTLRKLQEMLDRLRETWPEGAEWPLCRVIVFNRPAPAKKKAAERKIIHSDATAA